MKERSSESFIPGCYWDAAQDGAGGGKPQEISVLQKKMIVKIRSLYLLSCFTMQNTDKKAK